MSASQPLHAKVGILLAGYSGSGKTSLVQSMKSGKGIVATTAPTVGNDVVQKEQLYEKENINLKLTYHDVSGEQHSRSVRNWFAAASQVIILVLNLDDKRFFSYREQFEELRTLAELAPIFLVATKVDLLSIDLDERARQISDCLQRHDVSEITQGMMHAGKVYVVSSRTREGMDELESDLEQVYKLQKNYSSAYAESLSAAAFSSLESDQPRHSISSDSPTPINKHFLIALSPAKDGSTPHLEARGALAAARANAIATRSFSQNTVTKEEESNDDDDDADTGT